MPWTNRKTSKEIAHKLFMYGLNTFVSLHDSYHKGVVRIFCSPFLQAVRLFIYLFIYLQVATTLLVAGSTLDTLADSVCINQVVLKRHSKHQAAG